MSDVIYQNSNKHENYFWHAMSNRHTHIDNIIVIEIIIATIGIVLKWPRNYFYASKKKHKFFKLLFCEINQIPSDEKGF